MAPNATGAIDPTETLATGTIYVVSAAYCAGCGACASL
jgi:Pyruvate/2-oxoacid:ferredoxin oxidoreductase delta subunit